MKIICFIFLLLITNYNSVKNTIEKNRKELQISYQTSVNKNEIIDKASKKLTSFLLDEVINHWYETKWSFEGHTETPKQGTIACGYFVSTTLRDVGFNLNRYKLAQKVQKTKQK